MLDDWKTFRERATPTNLLALKDHDKEYFRNKRENIVNNEMNRSRFDTES